VVPTEETDESKRGVCYWTPGDKEAPSILDERKRRYSINVPGCGSRSMSVHCASSRRALLAAADLHDRDHDVFFLTTCDGGSGRALVEHIHLGEVTKFQRRGKRFEMDAEVQRAPFHGTGPPRP